MELALLLQQQDNLFTLPDLLTLTGAATVTLVICNACQRAFNFNPRWLALIVAILLCLAAVAFTGQKAGENMIQNYFLGLLNGFLVFTTAVGANSMTGVSGEGANGAGENPAVRERSLRREPRISNPSRARRFGDRWF